MRQAEKAMTTLVIGLILAIPSVGIGIGAAELGFVPLWIGLSLGFGGMAAGFALVYHALFGFGQAEAML